MGILSLPLIQDGQVSFSGKECACPGEMLRGLILPRKSVVR